MAGWITLDRGITNHWIFQDEKKFKWWIIMLIEANHTDNKFVLGNEVFQVKRGQSCNSLRTWAKLFNVTPKTVNDFFKLLKKDKMISQEIIGKGKQSTTLVTIENYNNYQQEGKHKLLHEVNAEETQGKRKLPTNKNENNVKKDIGERKLQFASSLEPFKDIYSRDMLKAFLRYWAEPNPKKTKMKFEMEKTWDLTGRLETWSENQRKFNDGSPKQQQAPPPERFRVNG